MKSFQPLCGIVLLTGVALCLPLSGCSTPFWATDNELFLHLPGTERRSDKVEGVLRPWERLERIDEKGKEGAKAPLEEKKILVYQLIEEYKRSDDPLVRRAAIRALGQITVNAHIGPALETLLGALHEENLGNRIAASDALGRYALEVKSAGIEDVRRGILSVFAECYRGEAFSSDAGADKENNERKDFRLAILRNSSYFEDSSELVDFLAEAMDGEPLDDGAIRLAAMASLSKVTRKNYGSNYELWSQYVAYRQGKTDRQPKELSGFESAWRLSDIAIIK